MREFKFRCWDGIKMQDHSWIIGRIMNEVSRDRSNDVFKEDGLVIMQFIGFKDRNGNDIYEGDIIKQVYDIENNGYTIVEINWKKGRFNCRKIKESKELSPDVKDFLIFWIKEDKCEVIGNIFQNPELLK